MPPTSFHCERWETDKRGGENKGSIGNFYSQNFIEEDMLCVQSLNVKVGRKNVRSNLWMGIPLRLEFVGKQNVKCEILVDWEVCWRRKPISNLNSGWVE